MGITHKRTGRLPGPIFLDEKGQKAAGLYALTLIRGRTFDRGIGADDRPLPAYTPGYALRRAKLGRKVSPPDYTMTGRTRRSIRAVARRQGARIHIRVNAVGQRAIVASVLNKRGAGWMRFSPSDRPKFARALRTLIDATRKRQGTA